MTAFQNVAAHCQQPVVRKLVYLFKIKRTFTSQYTMEVEIQETPIPIFKGGVAAQEIYI